MQVERGTNATAYVARRWEWQDRPANLPKTLDYFKDHGMTYYKFWNHGFPLDPKELRSAMDELARRDMMAGFYVGHDSKTLCPIKERIDARVIRLFAEARKPAPTPPPSASEIALRKLVLARDALTKCVIQLSGTMEGASGGDAGSVLKSMIVQLRKKIKKLDRLIAEALKGDARLAGLADALTGIAGVGVLSAAKVVALVPELGTLGRRRSAAIAGLAPFTRDSGRCKGKTFISGGRAEVRRALFMPATVAI